MSRDNGSSAHLSTLLRMIEDGSFAPTSLEELYVYACHKTTRENKELSPTQERLLEELYERALDL